MKVLVIGSGAREHALAWVLSKSPKVDQVYSAPGTVSHSTGLGGVPDDPVEMANVAAAYAIDLTVVGPETPLAAGTVDHFRQRNLPIFGPTQAAARLESSKSFARHLMLTHSIPSPDFVIFDEYNAARNFLMKYRRPVVVKADGLAAGKGVFVCSNRDQALGALDECMVNRTFGSAGDVVVFEEWLEGQEVSVFAFTDGEHICSLTAACDYKRVGDGDQGPNTGGMGAYSPPKFWNADMEDTVRRQIMEPVVRAMALEGIPYQGALYAGLMLTKDGPKVLEFNCRLGDPEAQVILPRLVTDPVDVMLACIEGAVDRLSLEWAESATVGVVKASGGYPGFYKTGYPVWGLDAVDDDALVFQGGAKTVDGPHGPITLTTGGRVMTVVGSGETLKEASTHAYDNARRITFRGEHYRSDIGL